MATVTLHSSRTLDNAAVAAGTARFVQDKQPLSYSSTTADTLNLPLGVEAGFSFNIVNVTATTLTIAAGSGEALTTGSDTSIPAAEQGFNAFCVKSGATTWTVSKSST